MGRFDGYLLCTDLDGTFLSRGGQLIQRNLEALQYYMKEGGLFTLATGRSPSYIQWKYQNHIPMNSPFVAFNGAVIYDCTKKKNVYERCVQRTFLEDMLFEKSTLFKGAEAYFHTDTGMYLSYEETKDEDIRKCVFVFEKEACCLEAKHELSRSYGQAFDFNRSWPTGLELLNRGSDKGEAVRALCTMLGGIVQTLVCVGDFENDISMLRIADVGYAVDNALPSVKAVADRVTVACEDGAIEAIVDDLKREAR